LQYLNMAGFVPAIFVCPVAAGVVAGDVNLSGGAGKASLQNRAISAAWSSD
jgi:hypothetical protein